MTIFRDEFDVRFIIMFGVLLFIKCFSWIGAGRVEFMEQQPPERPLLSHIRLASSLVLLCSSCAAMAWHSVTSVLDNGRLKPNMMVGTLGSVAFGPGLTWGSADYVCVRVRDIADRQHGNIVAVYPEFGGEVGAA